MRASQLIKVTMFVMLSIASKSAFADSICVSYWPWGTCALWENTSTLSNGGGGGGGLDHFEVIYKNNCSRNIETAIHARDPGTNAWTTVGWWTIAPGQTAHVSNTKNSVFYVYAKTNDPAETKLEWSGSDTYRHVNNSGDVLGFRKVSASSTHFQRYTYNFNCDGISRYKAVALAWSQNGAWATRVRNTVAQAQNDALAACQAYGNGQCTLSGTSLSPQSQGCLSIARAPSGALFASSNSSWEGSRNQVLQNCGQNNSGCTLQGTSCNP